MSNVDSPVVSRRQRAEDFKASICSADILPSISSPIYTEKSRKIMGPRLSCTKLDCPSPSRLKFRPDGQFGTLVSAQLQTLRTRFPMLKKAQELALRVPPRVRFVFIFFWLAWKVVLLCVFLVIMSKNNRNTDASDSSFTTISRTSNVTGHSLIDNNMLTSTIPTRVLYIVTSSSEYGDGSQPIAKDQDRFLDQLLPVMIDGVESMIGNSFNLDVDVFLVCAYPLKPERQKIIRDQLPRGVGFQFWDDAAPFAYKGENISGSVTENKRALARQHRFVVRDKLDYYDMFLSFEDDMLVRGQHVHHYLHLSTEIERLLALAPKHAKEDDNADNKKTNPFFGDMTKRQLERLIPGFFRVETIVDKNGPHAEPNSVPIPTGRASEGDHRQMNIDPNVCCLVNRKLNDGANSDVARSPAPDDLIVLDTNIRALSLRQFPPESHLLDWVVLMPGPKKSSRPGDRIGGFWSGQEIFSDGEKKASDDLLGQQGGWMATKTQIIRMNNELCESNFLPPFYRMGNQDYDDLGSHNVEFWSGSSQIFAGGDKHCNMQRIISMDPEHFSNHLLYHTSNEKQLQAKVERIVRANTLFGQLTHVQTSAEEEKIKLQTG